MPWTLVSQSCTRLGPLKGALPTELRYRGLNQLFKSNLCLNFQASKNPDSVEKLELEPETEDENPERGNWTGKLDFLLSLLGYAVGELMSTAALQHCCSTALLSWMKTALTSLIDNSAATCGRTTPFSIQKFLILCLQGAFPRKVSLFSTAHLSTG